jgi:hypothetical protein
MGTLEYQHGRDASKEQAKQFRLKWFGPSTAEVWQRLALELGGEHQKTWRGRRVVVEHGPWQIVLDLQRSDDAVFTRMRAPYVNADGFRFCVFRKHLFSGLAEMMGLPDINVGQPDFDEQFIIRGNHEGKLRQLFANKTIRDMIMAHPRIRFEVRGDEGFFSRYKFPEGVDELRFTAGGIIKDIDRLKELYCLFAQTLHELCRMGSAYESGPDVKL